MALVQTVIQYLILIILIIAGFMFISSISLQDWMREEFSMNVPRELINQTKTVSDDSSSPVMKYINDLPESTTYELKIFCGLQKTCAMLSLGGLQNPLKLVYPEMKWCVNNDFFEKPSKYGLPPGMEMYTQYFKDEAKALQGARICMIIGLFFLAIAIVILIIKAFKWQKESVLATTTLIVLSCICVVAALALVHDKFKFKEDFERMKKTASLYFNAAAGAGRKRRDDGSPGYSEHYPSTTEYPPESGMVTQSWEAMAGGSGMGQGQTLAEMGKIFISVISTLKMEESIGSPLVMAGLGMGLLLLVIILNGIEFYLIKKHGGIEIKYQNVEMA